MNPSTSHANRTIGWKLDREDRERLLARFEPVFAQVVADHVTLASGVGDDAPLPTERSGEVVGRATDGAGVEALVVRIGGTTDRPDGSTYHLTWSLAEGRRAVESNTVIADHGWRPLEAPISIGLEPADFRH